MGTVAPAHAMNSVVWIKVLAHVLIVSSCCLIQSQNVTDDSTLLPSHDPAQSCNNGLGRLVYEKVSDHKVAGRPPSETISRTGLPIKVLEECVRRCQEDKMTSMDQCHSFDFLPGRRRSSEYLSPSILTT